MEMVMTDEYLNGKFMEARDNAQQFLRISTHLMMAEQAETRSAATDFKTI
jgi:hypothetical protein